MASEGEVTQGKSKTIWDPPTHEKWIDLAVEQVRAGNRNGSHLSKLGWKIIIEKFNLATKRNYDRKQMKNHWDNVKKEWQLWDSLLRGETGLGWDIQRQTVDAPDEWWDAKLRKYLDAAKFRVRGLEHSFKLDELYRDVTATGARAWAPTSGSLCSVQEVIDKLVTLPGYEPMSPLFKVGTSLFTKKANREILVALK
ncbi:L10-interacting MYB domain-containing protein-like [Humulus lupulus]|uniref:L10-interacting MYB domain-containing protein-like n=1 Tax=Humulus lupulus TaxID=3486 RepID=UPI002B40AC5D|nr:L10-interacting MYB domain-containing protein-like [Humulus lupulus]